jgi:hypothetical protein
MGWSSQAVVAALFRGTDFMINSAGAFFYAGAPGRGNLIHTITNAGGSDDGHGNAYLAGDTTYQDQGDGTYLAFQDYQSALSVFSAPGPAGPWTQDGPVLDTYPGYMVLTGATPSVLWLFIESDQVIVAASNSPVSQTSAPLEVQGQVAAQSVTAIVSGAAETWHNMALLNGWSASGGYARYRMNPDKTVRVQGNISGGTITNGTAIWDAPAGYDPSGAPGSQDFPALILAGAAAAAILTPRVNVDTAGTLYLENIPSGTTQLAFSLDYSLS